MKVVIAPDSYKECLSAREVADALARALSMRGATPLCVPLSDGGEGTVDVLTAALGGEIRTATVSDPLGRPVEAAFGIVPGGTAIIEVAAACGLSLLSPEERNPLKASSRGVGELILRAYAEGCRHFIVGLGGTATCDGGEGMLSLLRGAFRPGEAGFEILCDVRAPFTGPEGAARIFAPQKGASPEEVEILERRMLSLAENILSETGKDVRGMPGAGAAGGLGGAFMAYFDAALCSGIDRIIGMTGFEAAVAGADLIITGEGRSDYQTLSGKVPYGVLRHSGGVPVILLSGEIEDREELLGAGFADLIQVTPDGTPLQEALRPDTALRNLREAAGRIHFD